MNDFNLLIAKNNFHFFKNLDFHNRLQRIKVNNDYSLELDERWLQPLWRTKDGMSRESLLKPIELTFRYLIENNCYVDELKMVLAHIKTFLIYLYGLNEYNKVFKSELQLIELNIIDHLRTQAQLQLVSDVETERNEKDEKKQKSSRKRKRNL